MFGEKNGMREKTRKQRRQTDKSKKNGSLRDVWVRNMRG